MKAPVQLEIEMLSLDEFSQLVALVYEAGLNPDLWETALLSITKTIGAVAGGLIITEPEQRTHVVAAIGSDPQSMQSYGHYYGNLDPFVPTALARPEGSVIKRELIVHPEAMRRSEFYNDWLRPQAVDDAIAITVSGENRPGAFVFATASKKGFGDEAVGILQLLNPHLRVAVRAQRWLGGLSLQRDSLLDLMSKSDRAVFFLDASGAVVIANASAEQFLRNADLLTVTGNRLRLSALKGANEFGQLLARAGGVFGKPAVAGTMKLAVPNAGQSLSVAVLPLGPSAVAALSEVRIAVIVSAQRATSVLDLQRAFGLTPAEARVAGFISNGYGVSAAAAQLRVAPSTVRTHLLRIFAKTETRRQAELAHLLARMNP